MKKRLHDKKAGIAILLTLIIVSLAEIVLRAVYLLDIISDTANYGEQIIVVILATTLLIFAAKGKDRISYLCYTAWNAYFVIDRIFSLPARITYLMANPDNLGMTAHITQITYIIGILCIISVGVMIVRYMDNGTICNKAFNILSATAIIMLAIGIVLPICDVIFNNYHLQYALVGINNLHQSVMVYFFTFFAYDSAKIQKNKGKGSK